MSTILDEEALSWELRNALRVNITDPLSRGSTSLETFDGDNSTTDFVITETSVKAIITVEHPVGTVLTYGTDWTYDESTRTITFTSAPTTGTDNIEINYKHGATWIYEDFSKDQITLSDFPRIAATPISVVPRTYSIGGKNWVSSIMYSITVAAKTKGTIDSIHKEIRTYLIENNKSFYHFTVIEPGAGSPYADSNLHKRIQQRTVDYMIPHKFEVGA